MALKDTWTDKLDGIDDVLASDINSIAQSAIALEENTKLLSEKVYELKEKFENQEVPKIELAPTLAGNDPDKAPSVQAVNAELANALKCEKSGTSLALTDISPLTHPLKVSVEGVEDLSSVKVLVPGKNLFNPNAWVNAIGRVTIDGVEYLNVKETPSSYYTFLGDSSIAYRIYFKYIRNSSFTSGTNIKAKDANGNDRVLLIEQYALPGKSYEFVVYGGEKLYFGGYNKNDICLDLSVTQLEFGTTRTSFEPFDPTEYPVNADGTVDGIKSIYPSTVLMTNTTGATIKCEYNRDAAKYADKVDGKLDMVSNAYTYNRVYAIAPNGTQMRLVASTVVAADALVQRGSDSQINVPTTPAGNNSATSKKYVDDITEPLQHAIVNALGTKYETITDTADDPWMRGLDNALRHIYIDHATVTFLDEDGNKLTDAIDITEMSIWSDSDSRTVSFTNGSYFEFEDGENMLYFEYDSVANGINYKSLRIDKKVVYQVKVGA